MALYHEWDWTAADASFTRALSLNPGDAFGRGCYAWFLLNRRRFDECRSEIRQAIACDPLSPVLYAFSVGLHAASGRCEEALAEFSRGQELAPGFGLLYFHAAVAHVREGRLEEAARTLEGPLHGLSPGWAQCILGTVRAKQGNREAAAGILVQMIEQRSHVSVSPTSIAWVAACVGEVDAAFEWFDRGYDERDTLMPFVHIYTDIFVPALARDPRFGALLERLNLADLADE
jgi:tetratricopeptide (TPR) repeat protein